MKDDPQPHVTHVLSLQLTYTFVIGMFQRDVSVILTAHNWSLHHYMPLENEAQVPDIHQYLGELGFYRSLIFLCLLIVIVLYFSAWDECKRYSSLSVPEGMLHYELGIRNSQNHITDSLVDLISISAQIPSALLKARCRFYKKLCCSHLLV